METTKFRRKNILYIHHGKGIGGAPLSLLYLIRALDRTKYNPMVLFLYNSDVVDLYKNDNIETFIGKGIYDFGHTALVWYSLKTFPLLILQLLRFIPSIIFTYKFLKSHDIDIVHLNTSSLVASAIAAKIAGCKIVWHVREPLHPGYFGIRNYLIKKSIDKLSDKTIPICKDNADRLIQSPNIKIIYNFVDFKQFDRNINGDDFKEKWNIGEKDKVVAMLGGVVKVKGTMEFVKAAKYVKQQIPNVKFLVIGGYPDTNTKKKNIIAHIIGSIKNSVATGKYHKDILNTMKKEGLKDTIVFTGTIINIPEAISSMDVLVFPSTEPHFARPIIEAGAMAKPVVASDLGGPDELVVNNMTGILVPPKDPKSLANAIVKILSDDQLAQNMGEQGYSRAKELFDAKKNAFETIQVYDEILGT